MRAFACVLGLLLMTGCAAQYRLSGERWGYDATLRPGVTGAVASSDKSGVRMVGVFEGESICHTRRALAAMAQQAPGARPAAHIRSGTASR